MSSLSLPIAAHSGTASALNLYSPEVKGFEDIDLDGLRDLAAQATGAIALAQRSPSPSPSPPARRRLSSPAALRQH